MFFSLSSLSPVDACELDERTPIKKPSTGYPSVGGGGGARHSRHQYPVGRKEGECATSSPEAAAEGRLSCFSRGMLPGGGAVGLVS